MTGALAPFSYLVININIHIELLKGKVRFLEIEKVLQFAMPYKWIYNKTFAM